MGNGKKEGTAFPYGTFGPNFAVVLLDDLLTDGQAQASASPLAGIGGIDLLKSLKNSGNFIAGNTSTLVLHRYKCGLALGLVSLSSTICSSLVN